MGSGEADQSCHCAQGRYDILPVTSDMEWVYASHGEVGAIWLIGKGGVLTNSFISSCPRAVVRSKGYVLLSPSHSFERFSRIFCRATKRVENTCSTLLSRFQVTLAFTCPEKRRLTWFVFPSPSSSSEAHVSQRHLFLHSELPMLLGVAQSSSSPSRTRSWFGATSSGPRQSTVREPLIFL